MDKSLTPKNTSKALASQLSTANQRLQTLSTMLQQEREQNAVHATDHHGANNSNEGMPFDGGFIIGVASRLDGQIYCGA